jgi:molybdate transport system substrate-binding protein
MTRRVLAAVAAAVLPLTLVACGSHDSSGAAGSGGGTLTVYAASSLTDAFTKMQADFEKQHSGVTVKFSFGGSSDLVAQLQNGAKADVFASADSANMDKLTGDGLQGQDPQDFASNTMEIATPPGNPAHVTSFADLTKAGLKLVTCAPEVPCGAAAQKIADTEGLTLKPVSEEQSVTDVLAKVTSGEADAGLVYVTDVKAAGDKVDGVTFPESSDAVNTYPITTLKASGESDLAKAWVDYVLSDAGQHILAADGFAKP